MTALRLLFSLLGGAVIAVLVVIGVAMAAMITAISTGRRIEVPGLVLAEAGRGPDLGSVRFLPPGILVWLLALTVAAAAVALLVGRRASRRERTPSATRS